jgi:uncharacterized repeat protein (TIGR03803 family)
MKKTSMLLTILLTAAFSFITKAQYSLMYDFTGNAELSTGTQPFIEQNLISDGTYLYGMTQIGGVANVGTVFKIKISDNSYTTLLDFDGTTNGSSPKGTLTSDGIYLYGMTNCGGKWDEGTVFKIQISNNVYTKILDFSSYGYGAYPEGSLFYSGGYLYGMTKYGGISDKGVVFKIQTSDNTFTKIFDFQFPLSSGSNPEGSLISDGTYLYGTTSSGGNYYKGTVFKIQISDNTFTRMIDFDGTTTGSSPNGALVSDGSYLYGMTTLGGANNMGTVFKIQKSNYVYANLLDFAGASNGSKPFGSLSFDGAYLYGMTNEGGVYNRGTVFKLQTSNNAYTKILDFAGETNGANPFGSLFYDGVYLYGMTNSGGLLNNGIVFKIQTSNSLYSKLFDFAGSANGQKPNGSLISDGTYLYGMTEVGGIYSKGTVFKIRINDNAYSTILDFDGTNGANPRGSLISDGTYLYGMSSSGGTFGQGTVFKIQISNNVYTKIFEFNQSTTGKRPHGDLITDGSYLYGMTNLGGTSNLGTVFKIRLSDNAYTTILSFTGASNGSNPTGSLYSDGTYLYGMCPRGGITDAGVLFKIQISDNTYTKLINFSNSLTGAIPYGSLISDGNYLYGMTNQGGVGAVGLVFKYDLINNTYSKIYDFQGTTMGGVPLGSLVSDGTYLYGMTNAGGTNSKGTVFKIELSNNNFTKLLDFDGINGENPTGNLIINGPFLYGMTPKGGFHSNFTGTIFKFILPPNAQATNLAFQTITSTQATINWTNGSGQRRMVFVKQESGLVVDPEKNTTYIASSDWAIKGSQLGASGYYCVYNGTGNSVSITNLQPNTQYTVQVFEYNGEAGIEQYLTATASNNPNSFTTKHSQNISDFTVPSPKTFGDDPFTVSATGGSSGNPVVFTSSDGSIAECSGTYGETVTIKKAGTVTIYANQAGNSSYDVAPQEEKTLIINKANQTINFPELPSKNTGDADFDGGATASSGLAVSYKSSNLNVATVVNGKIHIVGTGNSIISAMQEGNNDYNAAPDAMQILTVSSSTGIYEQNSEKLEVFPNPNSGRFSIRSQELLTGDSKVSMVDMNGKKISIRMISRGSEINIELDAKKGIYFLIIETRQFKAIKKVMIE